MATVRLKIEIDGAGEAFGVSERDNGGGYFVAVVETLRILEKVSESLRLGIEEDSLRDLNGNRVGLFSFKFEED